MKKLSIIIAMYNAENTISRCLNSIICPSHDDYEIIIIDDGSKDNSYSICKEYERLNNTIRVFRKQNEGVSGARNCGIEFAEGEYIWFIDSDDWLDVDSINILIKNLYMYDPDYYQIGFKEVEIFKDVSLLRSDFDENLIESVTENEIWSKYLYNEINSFAWSHIVKKNIFLNNHIHFPIGRIFEDTAITYKLLQHSKRVFVDNNVYYMYYKNSNSLSHNMSIKKIDDLLFMDRTRELELEKCINSANKGAFNCFFLNNRIQALTYIYKMHLNNEVDKQSLYRFENEVINRIKVYESEITFHEYLEYSRRCTCSMIRNYILYKLCLLKPVIWIKQNIKGTN